MALELYANWNGVTLKIKRGPNNDANGPVSTSLSSLLLPASQSINLILHRVSITSSRRREANLQSALTMLMTTVADDDNVDNSR